VEFRVLGHLWVTYLAVSREGFMRLVLGIPKVSSSLCPTMYKGGRCTTFTSDIIYLIPRYWTKGVEFQGPIGSTE
jgi:hypothetical protein